MAGTAKSYDATKIILGPCDIWLNVGVPAGGARATIDTTSGVHSPDATASPSAKHLGMTEAGGELIYKPEVAEFTNDESTAPFLTQIISETLTFKANAFQAFDFALLSKLVVGGTYSTGTGYEQIILGGLASVTTYSVLLLASDINSPTLYYLCAQIYKTYNKLGFSMPISRKKPSSVSIELSGLAITTRTAGDQVGNIWKKTA